MKTEISSAETKRLAVLVDSLAQAKKDKTERDAILNGIMDVFRANNIKSYRQDGIVIRFTDARQTNQFDVDLLREKYPAIWEECHSVQTRPPHISIKKAGEQISGEPTDEELDL